MFDSPLFADPIHLTVYKVTDHNADSKVDFGFFINSLPNIPSGFSLLQYSGASIKLKNSSGSQIWNKMTGGDGSCLFDSNPGQFLEFSDPTDNFYDYSYAIPGIDNLKSLSLLPSPKKTVKLLVCGSENQPQRIYYTFGSEAHGNLFTRPNGTMPIDGAVVRIARNKTGIVDEYMTFQDGNCSFPSFNSGDKVKISKSGFIDLEFSVPEVSKPLISDSNKAVFDYVVAGTAVMGNYEHGKQIR